MGGNKQALNVLAKQLVNVRKQKTRTYSAQCKVQAVGSASKAMGANVKMAETMGATSKVMANMNKMMNPQQVAKNMQEFKGKYEDGNDRGDDERHLGRLVDRVRRRGRARRNCQPGA